MDFNNLVAKGISQIPFRKWDLNCGIVNNNSMDFLKIYRCFVLKLH